MSIDQNRIGFGFGRQIFAALLGCMLSIGIVFGTEGFTLAFWKDHLWEVVFLPQLFPIAIWLALMPICWLFASGQKVSAGDINDVKPIERTPTGGIAGAVFVFFLSAFVSLAINWHFGNPFVDLPPLLHDEYSYLFQARTFQLGRVTNPSVDSDAFFQTHVLTKPAFVSRYFPGTGVWLLPFVQHAKPIHGEWAAAALACGFLGLAGRRFSPVAGYIAGLTCACAPGMIVFGNLLLSVAPTILALSIFLWSYLGIFDRHSKVMACIAGLAMAAAFLTRPMTAVGFGFPFGLHALYCCCVQRLPSTRFAHIALLITGFSLGPIGLLIYNHAVTGRLWESPYGLYMKLITPSHEYGFYNKERGVAKQGPTTDLAYDSWVENHTPDRIVQVIATRWTKLLAWSMGIIPASICICFFLVRLPQSQTTERLLVLGMFGLTCAYAPYWYAGVLDFSYIAEAMPALLLLIAVQLGLVWKERCYAGRRLLGWWWLTLPVLASGIGLIAELPGVFSPTSSLVMPRLVSAEMNKLIDHASQDAPIVVFVNQERKNDLQSTLVHNNPDLSGAVVRMWFQKQTWHSLHEQFSNRAAYLLTPGDGANRPTLVKIAEPIKK